MDKYSELLSELPFDLLHIAQSFANDNKSPKIEPAHLLRGLLHKSAGMVNYIEDTLDEDYYYLVDWADMRMKQCDKSPYPMKGIELSRDAQNVVKEAKEIADNAGLAAIDGPCLLASLVSPGVGFSYDQLKTLPLQPEKIKKQIGSGAPVKPAAASTSAASAGSGFAASADNDYCADMLAELPEAAIIGFDSEVRSMTEVLARKDRANLLLVGETGVGKTSLIQAILQRVRDKKVPASLEALQPFELDLIALSQGVSYKGEIEDRFKQVTEQLAQQTQPLLVIENFHRVEDKQSTLNGVLPGLKKLLSKNQLQVLITSTVDGYTKDIEKDKELTAFFEKITVEEPTEQQAIDIIKAKRQSYEEFHHLPIDDEVPAEIVRLAKRYMPDRRLPSSALDLLDRAMASTKINNELAALNAGEGSAIAEKLEKDAVRDVVAKMTGIPMGNIQSEEREKLGNAEQILHQRVVGQSHAIKSILDAIFESRSGLNKKGQPMGSFFFLGPTGTGKTELAKSLANFLFDDETAMLRFDMSEYKEEHSVALLYGAPPGYVGYEEGGLLVNQIRQHPYSVVLFDEIEKAHKSVFDLFLQILDEGKLHDRLGRVGDFSNSLIIFTSNIGSEYIFKSFGEGKVPTHDQLLEVMQGNFRPEFLARLTEIVPFSPITTEMINRIFDIHIKNLLKTLNEQNIKLVIDDSARKYVTSVGFNAHYGARPILGIIRKEIRRPLSKLIISGDIQPGDTVTMKYDEEKKQINWDIDDGQPEPAAAAEPAAAPEPAPAEEKPKKAKAANKDDKAEEPAAAE
ncbi:MAG: ATP-dependent Clp protease ATP-binding subunit [Prevotella sp.]|nr:ATP-dependent Clp protease ATP-binding subunit [Prevotella sp.]